MRAILSIVGLFAQDVLSSFSVSRAGVRGFAVLFCIAGIACAHDPQEISATVYQHTNRLEIRAVLVRPTIMRIADRQGVHLLDFSRPEERDEAMPVLRSQANGLFVVLEGTNFVRAGRSEVVLGAEDHVGFNLVFPVTNTPIRIEAKLLAHLPADEHYGVSLVALDMVSNQVVTQQLLNFSNPATELNFPSMQPTKIIP